MDACWPEPDVAARFTAGPALFVNAKAACATTPTTLAFTLYVPALLLAVNAADVASPFSSVVAVFTPPANVPLAPLPGTLNVTTTPAIGLPLPSVTFATRGRPKAVLMSVFCGVPLLAATTVGVAPVPFIVTTRGVAGKLLSVRLIDADRSPIPEGANVPRRLQVPPLAASTLPTWQSVASAGSTGSMSDVPLPLIFVMVADPFVLVFVTTDVRMALVVPMALSVKFTGFGLAAKTADPAAAVPVPCNVVDGLFAAPEAVIVKRAWPRQRRPP